VLARLNDLGLSIWSFRHSSRAAAKSFCHSAPSMRVSSQNGLKNPMDKACATSNFVRQCAKPQATPLFHALKLHAR
jgi:hypothetical protein